MQAKEALPRVLTLCIFREFLGKFFVLFFVLPKVPEAGTLAQKQATLFLHEVLWAKGYRVNSLDTYPVEKAVLQSRTCRRGNAKHQTARHYL